MSKLIRIALIVVIVACLGSGYVAYKLDLMKKDHLARIAFLTDTLATTSNNLVRTEKTLEETKTTLKATEEKLATTEANLKSTQVALDEKKQEVDSLQAKLTESEQKLQTAQTELTSVKDSLQKIKDALKTVGVEDVADIEQLAKTVAAKTAENKVLGDKVERMRTEVASLNDKVVELSTTPVNLRAHVISVREDWNFVVLDVGRNDRVQTNAQFLVYRDTKMIGKVQVNSVQATTSIAEILPDYRTDNPRVGDLVVH